MSSPAKLGTDFLDLLLFHKKNGNLKETYGNRGLNRVWSHQSAPNRLAMDIGMYPMLRRLAQLQKVAENDHFYCGVDSHFLK